MFCCTLLYVHSSFAIILMGKRELVALLSLSSCCLMIVVWLFLAVLLHFSLSVKAVTLIFISGRDLAISSTHEGKTGNINGKTENFNCWLRVNKYKLDSVRQKDP